VGHVTTDCCNFPSKELKGIEERRWKDFYPPSLLFSQNLPINTMRKPFSQKEN